MVRQRRPHFVEKVDEVTFFYKRIQDSSLVRLEINSQPQTWDSPRLSNQLRLLRQTDSTTLALSIQLVTFPGCLWKTLSISIIVRWLSTQTRLFNWNLCLQLVFTKGVKDFT